MLPFGPRPEPAPDHGEVELWRDTNGAICAKSYFCDDCAWVDVPGAGLFRLGLTTRKITAFPDGGASGDLLSDAYFRTVLPIALPCYGYEVLHASAVLAGEGVLGFCATSGTGKSTLAAAFRHNGYLAFADDALALDFDAQRPTITAISVPFSIRLAEDSVLRSTEATGESAWTSCPLAALCVLERSPHPPSAPEILRLPLIGAFSGLLPHAYYFTLGDQARRTLMFSRYLELASRVPVYKITFAADFSRLPGMMKAIEESVAGGGGGNVHTPTATHPRAE